MTLNPYIPIFILNEFNINSVFDTTNNNGLLNSQIPKTSDYPPYIDDDTIAFCDFNEGETDYFGHGYYAYSELINPGIEGEQSIIIPYNKQPVSYGISFSNEIINIEL